MNSKSHILAVRVSPQLKEAVERAARDDHRSVSGLIEKMLSEKLTAERYLPPAKRESADG
jgi:hypothetical protein